MGPDAAPGTPATHAPVTPAQAALPQAALAQAAALERAGRLASGVHALAEARMDAPCPSPADHALWVLAGELAVALDEARTCRTPGRTTPD